MTKLNDMARRSLLRRLALGLSLAPWMLAPRRAPGADLPVLSESDPAAKALDYVEDASHAKAAAPGSSCDNCSIYSAGSEPTLGSCSLFPGKQVKAAGWCSAWSGL